MQSSYNYSQEGKKRRPSPPPSPIGYGNSNWNENDDDMKQYRYQYQQSGNENEMKQNINIWRNWGSLPNKDKFGIAHCGQIEYKKGNHGSPLKGRVIWSSSTNKFYFKYYNYHQHQYQIVRCENYHKIISSSIPISNSIQQRRRTNANTVINNPYNHNSRYRPNKRIYGVSSVDVIVTDSNNLLMPPAMKEISRRISNIYSSSNACLIKDLKNNNVNWEELKKDIELQEQHAANDVITHNKHVYTKSPYTIRHYAEFECKNSDYHSNGKNRKWRTSLVYADADLKQPDKNVTVNTLSDIKKIFKIKASSLKSGCMGCDETISSNYWRIYDKFDANNWVGGIHKNRGCRRCQRGVCGFAGIISSNSHRYISAIVSAPKLLNPQNNNTTISEKNGKMNVIWKEVDDNGNERNVEIILCVIDVENNYDNKRPQQPQNNWNTNQNQHHNQMNLSNDQQNNFNNNQYGNQMNRVHRPSQYGQQQKQNDYNKYNNQNSLNL